MSEHPMLFKGDLVRAILDGRKTVTRRFVKPSWWRCLDPEDEGDRKQAASMCPYGQAGDRIWVRESFRLDAEYNYVCPTAACEHSQGEYGYKPAVKYIADGEACGGAILWGGGRPSIHMPRWASRIDLEIVSVRAERVQDIDEADAEREGVEASEYWDPDGCIDVPPVHVMLSPRETFAALWDSINGKRHGASWADNPWVWVIEFRRVRQ